MTHCNTVWTFQIMEEKFLIRLISFCNYADHIHKQFVIIDVVMHTAVEMNHLRLKVTQFYDVNGRERESVYTHVNVLPIGIHITFD